MWTWFSVLCPPSVANHYWQFNDTRCRDIHELRFCDYDTLLMHKWFGNESEFETIALQHASVAFPSFTFLTCSTHWHEGVFVQGIASNWLINTFRFMALIIDFPKFDISYPKDDNDTFSCLINVWFSLFAFRFCIAAMLWGIESSSIGS